MSDIQQWRADALAEVVSIVLYELEHGGVQPHTHALLRAALAAYEAGKGEATDAV